MGRGLKEVTFSKRNLVDGRGLMQADGSQEHLLMAR